MSNSQVSRLCGQIDDGAGAILDRPREDAWPGPWRDATFIEVRRGDRIVSVAAMVAALVSLVGRIGVPGIAVQPRGAEVVRGDFPRFLADRDRRGTRLAIAGERKRRNAAAVKVLGVTVQRCRARFPRNALACVGRNDRPIC